MKHVSQLSSRNSWHSQHTRQATCHSRFGETCREESSSMTSLQPWQFFATDGNLNESTVINNKYYYHNKIMAICKLIGTASHYSHMYYVRCEVIQEQKQTSINSVCKVHPCMQYLSMNNNQLSTVFLTSKLIMIQTR